MSREEKLAEFVGWAQQLITGDEKGQAQIFLDRLFQAFGHAGVLDVGGQTEFRIRQAAEDGGGTAFADLVWRPVISAMAAARRAVGRVRTEASARIRRGLCSFYRTLELSGANPLKDSHAALDAAVLAAYGFSAKKDLLAQLLALNLAVSQRMEKGELVTPPGIPANFPKPEGLISDDCIRPEVQS
jgi:hypothetical protein